MCGIVGIHGPQADEWIDAMNAAQVHRGPDGGDVFRDRAAGIALAMRRLAIIDVEGGHQPMQTADGRHVLVFNGEIFNSPDLRRELDANGQRFATDHSDTETLLHLLVRHGKAALPRLNGMFAFAFLDRAEGRLLLARDRMGIKPLHYVRAGGRLAFASELKSLLRLPFVERAVDRQSLFHYLTLHYVPGRRTIVAGVDRLEPGSLLEYRLADGDVRVERWWRPAFRPDDSVPAREWPERIRATLAEAVRRWSLSDVPIACSLSGGLDSSALVGLLAQAGERVRTVSLGFRGAGEDAFDELPLARRVAERWGTEHSEIVLRPEALIEALPAMVSALDEPYGGGLPSWSVFAEMARSVKVGFTGSGGDELFGNYGKWIGLEGGRLRRRLAPRGPQAVDGAVFARAFTDRYYYFADAEKRAVLADGGTGLENTSDMLHGLFRDATGPTTRDRTACVDLATQLPEEFLMMTDRFSMAHSLEARTPFLDNAMVELALSIPARRRTDPADLKGLLRRAVAPLLPPELLAAPKKGFVIPLGGWMRGPLRGTVERLLSRERLAAQGLFRPELFDRWVRSHLEGRADLTRTLWALVMFQLWHAEVVEGWPAELVA